MSDTIQQRRIFQVGSILAELPIGVGQVAVLVLPLVLPGELGAPPDIGEAAIPDGPLARPGGDRNAFSKAYSAPVESCSAGVGCEQPAQVDEMLLAGRPFGKLRGRHLAMNVAGVIRRIDSRWSWRALSQDLALWPEFSAEPARVGFPN